MSAAARLALTASGFFLLMGLLSGVWKYHGIRTRPEHRAHVYVDVAHRASLLYSFAGRMDEEQASLRERSELGPNGPIADRAVGVGPHGTEQAKVMMKLVEYSPYSSSVQLWAVAVPVFFFAVAVASYVYHGLAEDTDNQLRVKTASSTFGMALLILGEIGGVAVLFWGFLRTQVL